MKYNRNDMKIGPRFLTLFLVITQVLNEGLNHVEKDIIQADIKVSRILFRPTDFLHHSKILHQITHQLVQKNMSVLDVDNQDI